MFCWIFLCPILLSGSFTLYFKVSFIFNVGTDKLPNGNISRRAHMVKVLAYFKRPFAPTKIAQPDNQPIWAKVALHNEFHSQTHTLMTFLDEIKKFISGKILGIRACCCTTDHQRPNVYIDGLQCLLLLAVRKNINQSNHLKNWTNQSETFILTAMRK